MLKEKQIEKYKEEHPNEEIPKKVRNIEIKLGMTYEGWKETGKNRYALVGKEYVAGYMTGEEIKQYEQEKVEAYQEDKLKAGEKETPIVYQEADGIMIYTQGEDRKNF